MAYIALLFVVVANCVALFLVSLLFAGGDGSADGVKTAWAVGYPWIAAFSIAALALLRRGSKSWLAVAVGTLPAAWAAGMLFIVGANLLGFRVG